MNVERTRLQSGVALTDAIREVLATTFSMSKADLPDTLAASELPAWDSLHHFTLIVALEDRFGVTYTSDEIPQMTSVPAIARVTAYQLGLNGAA